MTHDPASIAVSPETPGGPRASTAELRWLAAILAVTVLVYAQCLRFQFVAFDDNLHVYENPHVASGISLANLRWAFGIHGPSQWHPLAWMSHQADSQLFGARPSGPDAGGHHGVNVLLHLCNVALVYATFRSLLGRAEPAILSAAIFAVHPLNVESVAWVSERRNVLCVAFSLATIMAYRRYVGDPRAWRYAIVAAMLALALMAKPLAVTVPCVLCLLDLWPLHRAGKRLDPARHSLSERIWSGGLPAFDKLPLFALAAGSCFLTIRCQEAAAAVMSSHVMPLPVRLLNALAAYGEYLRSMIWPVRLCYFYPHPAIRHADPLQPLLYPAIVGACLLVLLTVTALAARRSHPAWLIGWLWYVGTLVPMIGLFQVGTQQRADRYLYFPMLGLLLALTAHIPWERLRSPTARRWLWGLSALAVGLLAVRAWDQAATWRDSLTLFEHGLTIDPRNKSAHVNAGRLRHEHGEWDLAARHCLAALEIDPDYATAHCNLGALLHDAGRVEDATAHLTRAVRLDPRCVPAWVRLGAIEGGQGRMEVAERCFRSACEADPRCSDAWFNLGIVLEQVDRRRAREAFAMVLTIDPDSEAARARLERLQHDDTN
jgi:tetratricopeptide (TPR) repeat protein